MVIRNVLVLSTVLVALAPGALAQKPDRSKPPAPGPTPALKLPAIQKRVLGNGLPVWIVELHEVPVVQINLLVLSGSAEDPAAKFGLGSLTAAMLDEGAGGRSALELADAIDYLGATLSTASSFDASAIRLHVPVARAGDGLAIMADVATAPTFPPDELERLRKERLTGLLQARDDPPSIAAVAFPRLVYPASHRYGTGGVGTEAALGAFTVDDLHAFYRSHYRPDNAALIVAGDVTPGGILPALEASFGKWRAERMAADGPAIAPAPQLTSRHVFLVDKPGAAQSSIRIGWIGVARSTPDYFVLQVLNTILGGSFTSRLNQNLREQHGYAYGAGSVFDMRRLAGPFYASAAVETDKTGEALKEFFKELNGLLEPVSAGELAKAKNYVALGFPAEFETTGDISRKLEELVAYRLPENYFSSYVEKIQAVTTADVQRAARKYIQPDKFAVVVVGDRARVEAPIKSLDLGPLTVLTVEEVFRPAAP